MLAVDVPDADEIARGTSISGIRKFRNHDALSCLTPGDGLSSSSDNVCFAIINSSSVGMT